jgi:hypothetical protein
MGTHLKWMGGQNRQWTAAARKFWIPNIRETFARPNPSGWVKHDNSAASWHMSGSLRAVHGGEHHPPEWPGFIDLNAE